jgi:hypothetical protein
MNQFTTLNSGDILNNRSMSTIELYNSIQNKLKTDHSIILNPYDVIELLPVKHYNSRELNKIYAHLLNYTYAATALEVKNHEVVNKHLQDIHNLLNKLVKENPNLIKTPEGQLPQVPPVPPLAQ